MTSHFRVAAPLGAMLLLAAAILPCPQVAFAQSSAAASASAASTSAPADKEAARQALLKMSASGLAKLYKVQPEARKTVEGAAGYAVFDVSSIYAIMFVGQRGQGVMIDNTRKKTTYMSSSRMGTGPGAGKQRVYQIFVFKNKGSMEQFVAVGGVGGDVSMSTSTGTGGMVRSANPNIEIYQVPESGMAVQASWGGTVYAVDNALN